MRSENVGTRRRKKKRERRGMREELNPYEIIVCLQCIGSGKGLHNIGAFVNVIDELRVVLMKVEGVEREINGNFAKELLRRVNRSTQREAKIREGKVERRIYICVRNKTI